MVINGYQCRKLRRKIDELSVHDALQPLVTEWSKTRLYYNGLSCQDPESQVDLLLTMPILVQKRDDHYAVFANVDLFLELRALGDKRLKVDVFAVAEDLPTEKLLAIGEKNLLKKALSSPRTLGELGNLLKKAKSSTQALLNLNKTFSQRLVQKVLKASRQALFFSPKDEFVLPEVENQEDKEVVKERFGVEEGQSETTGEGNEDE